MSRLALMLALVVATVRGELPGFEEKCRQFGCPRGKIAVQRAVPRFTSPGCTGWGMGNMFGFGMGGQSGPPDPNDPTNICCDLLHACWQTCNMPNLVCAKQYKKCYAKVCSSLANPQQAGSCMWRAEKRNDEIAFSGCPVYEESQQKSCQCVEDGAKVTKARHKFLKNFYKATACKADKSGCDEKLAKIGELAEKYSSPAKFATLVGKLLAKWPRAIERAEDKEKDWMENAMNEAMKQNPEMAKKAKKAGMSSGANEKARSGAQEAAKMGARGASDRGASEAAKRRKRDRARAQESSQRKLNVEVDDLDDLFAEDDEIEEVELEDDDEEEGRTEL